MVIGSPQRDALDHGAALDIDDPQEDPFAAAADEHRLAPAVDEQGPVAAIGALERKAPQLGEGQGVADDDHLGVVARGKIGLRFPGSVVWFHIDCAPPTPAICPPAG